MSISTMALQDYREIARLAGHVLRLHPGDVLFREGDLPGDAFVLLSGTVDVSVRERTIETVQPGDGLGILSLLDGQPRSATATAVDACEVAALDERCFRFVVETTPGFVWFVLGEMAQRLRATNAAL